MGIAVDVNSNVYVAIDNSISEVASQGGFITFGSSSAGEVDGPIATALFSSPRVLTVDSSGDIFFQDVGSADIFARGGAVREISANGIVSTIAGGPVAGSADGKGSAAQFNGIGGIVVDKAGNLYLTDNGNSTIRKITPDGTVSTLAGSPGATGSADGKGSAARFYYPDGIAINASGTLLYVADFENNTIRSVAMDGTVVTIAGQAGVAGSADGPQGTGTFYHPTGIAVGPDESIFVCDTYNGLIRKIPPDHSISTVGGILGTVNYGGIQRPGVGTNAGLGYPEGIAVDTHGKLYIADLTYATLWEGVPSATAPSIAVQPSNQTAAVGANATLWVGVSGSPTFSYQWYFNGVAIPNASSSILTLSSVQAANTGSYTVTVSNAAGLVTSNAATLTVNATSATAAPLISQEPTSQVVANGSTAVFAAGGQDSASSSDLSYQWFCNGQALVGSTGKTLVVSGATSANEGSYVCLISNASGAAVTGPATLNVVATSNPGRLVNISCRAQVGTGTNILIAGFVVGGQGTTGSEPLLVRASGPALAPFGVTGALADPQLQLFSGNDVIGTNDGWAGNAQVSSIASAEGAFSWLDSSSHDAALANSLPIAAYTAQVTGQSGDTGVALAEIYDATASGAYTPTSPRLINISARVLVGTGSNVLIAGFVIGGTTSKTVLIRASGPALVPFGIKGTLTDPQLKLNNSSGTIAANTGWGGDVEISAESSMVGAFSWGPSSTADSALLVTLPPGAYTAQISGASGDSGIALVEIYDVP